LRGRGVGDALLSEAIRFCAQCDFPSIYLWTFEGLHAAHNLYQRHGFILTEERIGSHWGVKLNEQRYELLL
jgi:GNAT superfamily N-acetyltransferase